MFGLTHVALAAMVNLVKAGRASNNAGAPNKATVITTTTKTATMWSSSFERAIMLEHQIRRPGYHKPMALAIDQQHEKSELLNCRSRMPLIDVCTEEHQKARSSWSARVVASWHSSSVQARGAILLRLPIRQALSPAYWLTVQMADLWMYCIEEMCQCKRTTCPL